LQTQFELFVNLPYLSQTMKLLYGFPENIPPSWTGGAKAFF